MDNISIWEKDLKLKKEKNSQLTDNDKDIDILIIGGGIIGITTSYFLKDSNKKIVLIDKSQLGMGVTSKTTAKLNYLQEDIYSNLEKNFNRIVSKKYLDSQLKSIDLIKEIIKKEKINCDLEECDSYIFTKDEKGVKRIEKEKKILEDFNIPCQLGNNLPIENFPVLASLKVNNTYTINPLKYLNGLITKIEKNISIYENTHALEIIPKDDYFLVQTNIGDIKCKKVIVTTHYPFFLIPGFIPLKTYVKREYVNSSKYDIDKHFTAIGIDKNLHSIRFYNDYIIYVSNSNRLTSKIDYEKNYLKSQSDFKRLFSKEPEFTWMNQDIMSNDNLPMIGRINDNPNLLIATAFNSWGITNSGIAGKLLSDLALEKTNEYTDLFNPLRNNITSFINSLIGTFHYAKVYIQTTIKKNPIFYNDKVYIVKINGKYYGVYYDNYGKKHIVKHKCPHMKCNLVFNNYEKTWDCPCHGSRFDIDGNVIEGPSKYNIRTNL